MWNRADEVSGMVLFPLTDEVSGMVLFPLRPAEGEKKINHSFFKEIDLLTAKQATIILKDAQRFLPHGPHSITVCLRTDADGFLSYMPMSDSYMPMSDALLPRRTFEKVIHFISSGDILQDSHVFHCRLKKFQLYPSDRPEVLKNLKILLGSEHGAAYYGKLVAAAADAVVVAADAVVVAAAEGAPSVIGVVSVAAVETATPGAAPAAAATFATVAAAAAAVVVAAAEAAPSVLGVVFVAAVETATPSRSHPPLSEVLAASPVTSWRVFV